MKEIAKFQVTKSGVQGNPVILKNAGEKLPKFYSISVRRVGGTSSTWSATLEVSLDEVNYTILLTHTQASTGVPIWAADAIPKPAVAMRLNFGSLSIANGETIEAVIAATS